MEETQPELPPTQAPPPEPTQEATPAPPSPMDIEQQQQQPATAADLPVSLAAATPAASSVDIGPSSSIAAAAAAPAVAKQVPKKASAEDEENLDEYEKDDFVVSAASSSEGDTSSSDSDTDESSEGEEEDNDAAAAKRRKLKREHEKLDQDDLLLIEEAAQSKHARVVNSSSSSSSEEDDMDTKKPPRGGGGGGIDDVADFEDEDQPPEALGSDVSSNLADSEDEEADFIVDDLEGELPEGEEGRREARRRRRARRAERRERRAQGGVVQVADISPEQQDEYDKLFGFTAASEFALSDAEDEAQKADEEEEEMDELEAKRAQAAKRKQQESLYASFEPDDLVSKFMTEADDKIRARDEPERAQLGERVIVNPDSQEEMDMQVKWVHSRLWDKLNVNAHVVADALIAFQRDGLEPATAHLYRADDLGGSNLNVLWAIHDEAAKFQVFFAKLKILRHKILTNVPDTLLDDELRHHAFWTQPLAPFFEPRTDLGDVPFTLEHSRREAWLRELSENYAEMSDEYLSDSIRFCETHLAGTVGSDMAQEAVKVISPLLASVSQVASSFVLDDNRYDRPLEHDESPHDISLRYTELRGATGDEAIKAAVGRLARELASEPRLRQTFLRMARREGTVTSILTSKGKSTLADDPMHAYYCVSGLTDKPVQLYLTELEQGASKAAEELILLRTAEEEGILNATFNMDALAAKVFVSLARYMLASVDVAFELENEVRANRVLSLDALEHIIAQCKVDHPWDQARLQALRNAVFRGLAPSIEAALKDELFKQAERLLVDACAAVLSRRAFVQPLSLPVVTDPEVETYLAAVAQGDPSRHNDHPICRRVAHCKVLALQCSLERDELSAAVLVDAQGRLLAKKELPALGGGRVERETHALFAKLGDYIAEVQPHVVLVNASGGVRARNLVRALKLWAMEQADKVLNKLHKKKKKKKLESHEWGGWFYSTLILDDVALAVADTPLARKEEPGAMMRRALCLARHVQSPLTSVARLFADRKLVTCRNMPVLSVDLHEFKSRLAPDVLVPALERAVLNAVACAGVDLLTAVANEHMTPLLAFVPGLGFRKAKALVDHLRANPVRSRHAMKPALGLRVFENAAGFLKFPDMWKVDANDSDDQESGNDEDRLSLLEDATVLDSTRVSPRYAHNMAQVLTSLPPAPDEEEDEDEEDEDEPSSSELLSKKLEKRLRDQLRKAKAMLASNPSATRARVATLCRRFLDQGQIGVDDVFTAQCALEDELDYRALCAQFEDAGSKADHLVALLIEELRMPFGERRAEFRPPSADELFGLLSDGQMTEPMSLVYFTVSRLDSVIEGRTPSNLFVTCRPLGSKLREQEGLAEREEDRTALGSLVREFEDAPEADKPVFRQRLWTFYAQKFGLEMNKTAPARLLDVDKNALKLYVTMMPSLIKRPPQRDLGRYFTPPTSGVMRKVIIEKFRPRPIEHALFKNISLEECEAYLQTQPVGAVVFRPHGQDKDSFNLSWRCSKDPFVVKHELIEERTASNDYKPEGDYTLGAKLFMNKTEYSNDLREIVALYVEHQAVLINQVQSSEKYRNATGEEIKGLLLDHVTRQPNRLFYHVIHHPAWRTHVEFRGSFQIYFSTSSASKNPIFHTRLIVTPQGFLFCRRRFKNISHVFDYLKTHLDEVRNLIFEQSKAAMTRKQSRWGPPKSQMLPPLPGWPQQMPPQQHRVRQSYEF